MKHTIIKDLLAGFEYTGTSDFAQSLLPTIKYNMMSSVLCMSLLISWIDKIFGLSYLAIGALILVMLLELASGTYASKISKTKFSSKRLSRFTFKMACYLIMIAVPYLFHSSYKQTGPAMAASLFEWLHVFLVVQIVIENIISVLENVSVIQGKSKTYWIDKIRGKADSSL
jgi:hypothetical protein